MDSILYVGLDAGSTTIKVAVLDASLNLIYKDYRRHHAHVAGVLIDVFESLQKRFGNADIRLTLTGSAGMGVAERCGVSFLQEVVSSCQYITRNHPEVKTLVDIGGEDSKMIFFRESQTPDIRMNGSCAGGTGAFIDQMASILGVEPDQMGVLAEKATTTYPIASRCGVFSKTDVQNLLSRNIRKEDVAASVFHAVSMQVLTSLSRGYDLLPKVFLCGGPFRFIPALEKTFRGILEFAPEEVILSEHAEIVAAWGAALHASKQLKTKKIAEFIYIFISNQKKQTIQTGKQLKPLFRDKEDFETFRKTKPCFSMVLKPFADMKSDECYLGIDSGSTTTKIVAIDNEGELIYHYYEKNQGNTLEAAQKGLTDFHQKASTAGKKIRISGSCVTGYGEDLLKKAFHIENSVVETIAHYTAARRFKPNVSFILDIGGQDMKATFVENGTITRLEINEACSSGCGSFIETFAQGLNYKTADFSTIAGSSKNPCDLGTRCTVFMNSKVKQSLREGANIADISAGLGYSVIKNCLNKVLKMRDFSEMGEHIVVQGGAFRNHALIRALELETGKTVTVSNHPELMGAYGTALFAQKNAQGSSVLLDDFIQPLVSTCSDSSCKGCENQCKITRFTFENGNHFYAGNKCEKMVSNHNPELPRGINFFAEKYTWLTERKSQAKNGAPTIGMPRALGMYENYPFWHSLFTQCGFNVELSEKSTMKLYEKGLKSVMADNICFPAKIVHGHILNLIEKGVNRIFLPFVVYEAMEDRSTANSYNCPIVTGYSEVIRSALNPEKKYNVPFDNPGFSFKNETLLKKACIEYLRTIEPNLNKRTIEKAFANAIKTQYEYYQTLTKRCQDILRDAKANRRMVILLAGRPYHTDPLIQHKIGEIITGFGVDVVTEDVVRHQDFNTSGIQSILQWAYTNRILKAAAWVASTNENVHYVQLTSFGCGPDAFIIDEVSDILHRNGKNATFLKVDDINHVGSMRLRIRSLIESLHYKNTPEKSQTRPPIHPKTYTKSDRNRTFLLPWFSDFYSPLLPALFKLAGYNALNLPPSDHLSVEYGLKYSNNEICYPGTLVVGDFMKALGRNSYPNDQIALALTQTGGQCRASNYVSLLKKALTTAGLEHIPVVTIAMGGGVNEQPGFDINWKKIHKMLIHSVLYTDLLSQMYYATAPREKTKGEAKRIRENMLQMGIKAIEENDAGRFLWLIAIASQKFERALDLKKEVPQIGIVGEIYVKYNNFGHKNIINWLIDNGYEPVIPPLTDFFTAFFVNQTVQRVGHLEKDTLPGFVCRAAEKYLYKMIRQMEDQAKGFPYLRPFCLPEERSVKASEIISLNTQFGEGWSIAGDFAHFAQTGIHRIISFQPFGCIANQVISKGIEKRTRELYPELNLLFLDFDSGMSEANIMNRLHFMLENGSK